MMMMTMKRILLSTSSLALLITIFFSTTLAQQQTSPVQPPTSSPTTKPPAASASPPSSQGFNTVPLVPSSPTGAPTPSIPKTPTIDIVQILTKAKRFSVLIRLLKTTQLINQLNSQLITSGSGGLTVFAPEDNSFSKLKPGFLNSLTDREKVELLQFHTLSSFISISSFDTLTNPVQTQAGDDAQRLQLNVTTYGGNQVKMTTGAVNASVIGTVYTDNKLAIYQVDKVLVPLDLVLPKAKAPAPAKGVSGKGDKSKSSSSGDESGDGSDKSGSVHADSSSADYLRFKATWVPLVLVLGATM